MPVRNVTDGSTAAPTLRLDLNLGTLWDLPPFSAGPRGDERAVLTAVKAAGYRGVQAGNPTLARELGLAFSAGGRINQPQEADGAARQAKGEGAQALTVHVGWGMESDAEIDRLVGAVLEASTRHDLPMYIETHRATITQDIWRTVEFTKRHPDVRFNGDFSHWYTGLEMVYGDITQKFDFCEPVFSRVRFMHGRIGDPGTMQVDVGDGTNRTYVAHFQEMWTRSCLGFLRSAKPGDVLPFAPELLPNCIYYAQTVADGSGGRREAGDRWTQAQVLGRIAQAAFSEAQRRLSAGATAAAAR